MITRGSIAKQQKIAQLTLLLEIDLWKGTIDSHPCSSFCETTRIDIYSSSDQQFLLDPRHYRLIGTALGHFSTTAILTRVHLLRTGAFVGLNRQPECRAAP